MLTVEMHTETKTIIPLVICGLDNINNYINNQGSRVTVLLQEVDPTTIETTVKMLYAEESDSQLDAINPELIKAGTLMPIIGMIVEDNINFVYKKAIPSLLEKGYNVMFDSLTIVPGKVVKTGNLFEFDNFVNIRVLDLNGNVQIEFANPIKKSVKDDSNFY